jgi:hypothetical protein
MSYQESDTGQAQLYVHGITQIKRELFLLHCGRHLYRNVQVCHAEDLGRVRHQTCTDN